MAVLRTVGAYPGAMVPIIGAGLAVLTIGTCAAFAFGLGHVEWPADITHCARGVPEKYIFRAGLIPACVLIGYMFWMLESYIRGESEAVTSRTGATVSHDYANTLIGTLGVIAAACLVVSSSVIEDDGTTPWTLHSICASSFFILAVIAQITATSKLFQLRMYHQTGITSGSLFVKMGINALCISALLLDIVGAVYGWHALTVSIEWFLTLQVILYNGSLSYDWHKVLLECTCVEEPTVHLQLGPTVV